MRDRFPGLVNLGNGSQFVDEFANIIGRTRLFEDFEFAEVHKLAAKMSCYRAPSDALLIREGDEGDFGLVLLKGRAAVFKRDTSGHDVRIGEVGPGDTLGEMSMIDGQVRVASCLASEEVVFAVLDRAGLIEIIADDPRLGAKVLIELVQHLSAKLRIASGRLAGLLQV